jgi:hypothetical protein
MFLHGTFSSLSFSLGQLPMMTIEKRREKEKEKRKEEDIPFVSFS